MNWGFAGTAQTTNPTPDGVKAAILEYDPYVYEFVAAWSMLNLGTQRWAQVGWLKLGGYTSRSVFTQYTLNDTHGITSFWPERPVGTYTTYLVDYTPSTDTIRMQRDSNLLVSVVVSWIPNSFEIEGEAHNFADQMPGGTGAHEVFKNANMSYTGSPSWVDVNSSASTNWPSIYGAQKISTGRYEIWDKGCQS